MSFKVKDHYYKKAKSEDYLARSVYKLQEIDQKFKNRSAREGFKTCNNSHVFVISV